MSRPFPSIAAILFCLGLSAFSFCPFSLAEDVRYVEIRDCINQGNNLLARNLFKQAIEAYEKCLSLDPDNSYAKSNIVLAHNNWGIFYFHNGQYEKAKDEWQTALRLKPGDRNAGNNLSIWQQTMARLGKSTDLSVQAKAEPTKGEPGQEIEQPNQSAVVILNTNKHTPSVESNAKQSVEIKAAGNQTTSEPEQKSKEISQTGSKDSFDQGEPLIDKYSESGIESGAKILPRQPSQSDAPPKIDENINRLETKIYGQPRAETSVLKRLDRMELDSFGKVNSAPITERVSRLMRLFDLAN